MNVADAATSQAVQAGAAAHRQLGRWQTWLLLAGMFLLIWLPRGLALDRYVTDDEHKWLTRGANFLAALAAGDWGGTYQREHPGVTVMWAGAAALMAADPGYAATAPGPLDWNDDDIVTTLRARGIDPLAQLGRARGLVVLAISLALTLAYAAALRLFGLLPATAGFVLIALDPFQIALGRLLHLDALMSSLLLLALLEVAVFLYRGRRWGPLLLSGIAVGLAGLTKTPALILLPFGALLFAVEMGRAWRAGQRGTMRTLAVAGLAWGGVAVATFFVFWPAMWVNPVGTLGQVLGESASYATGGHTTQVFFAGEASKEDPGPWFYPATWLWRTTPIVLVGLGLAAVAAVVTWRRGRRHDWPVYAMLPAFVLLYLLAITLSDKKLDRYLLPVYAPIGVMAGWGWGWVIGLLGDWVIGRTGGKGRGRWLVEGGAIIVLAGLQGWQVAPTHPYYLTYFNPWLGGATRAPEVMMIGRGEGLDQAIDYLRTQVPDVDDLRILSWTNDNLWHLSEATLISQQSLARELDGPGLPGLQRWLGLDYAILYVHQWQRGQRDEALAEYLAQVEPEESIVIDGLEYARIYNLRTLPPPGYLAGGFRHFIDWNGQVRLVGVEGLPARLAPGDPVALTLHLQSTAPITQNLNLALRLVDQAGQEIYRADGWPWGRPTGNWPRYAVWPDGHQFTVPEGTPPGLYRLDVSLYDPATLDPLSARDLATGAALPAPVPVGYVRLGDAEVKTGGLGLNAELGEELQLRKASLPGAPLRPGDLLAVETTWAALRPLTADYTLFVHLLDSEGQLVAQVDRQPYDGFLPTRLWKAGDELVDTFAMTLPADLAPGTYDVVAGAYLPATGAGLPVTRGIGQGQDHVLLGQVQVAP